MTTEEALTRALEALREVTKVYRENGFPSAMHTVANKALTEIQKGLWVEEVAAGTRQPVDEPGALDAVEREALTPKTIITDHDGPRPAVFHDSRYLGSQPSRHSDSWDWDDEV